MNAVVTGIFFLSALLLTLSRGAGSAFAYAYLPALLLFGNFIGFKVSGLPDPTPPTAAVYGILGGAVLQGRGPTLRLVPVDYLFALLLAAYIASAISTEKLYTGVSIFGGLTLELIAPYFIARSSLETQSTQRKAIYVLVSCAVVSAVFALIEFRMWPDAYQRLMGQIGLHTPTETMRQALGRFGFFRAKSSFCHPIDLGNSAALIFVMIATLAVRSGMGLRGLWVRTGLCAALVALFTALSFTSFFALGAGLALYLLLTAFPPARRYLAAGTLTVIALGFLYAASVAWAPFSEFVPGEESALNASLVMRQIIIKQAWQIAASAGFFGWGPLVPVGDLTSVDNAYLVIAIQRGWTALALWLCVPVSVALLASRALRRARSREAIRAVLLGFCGTFGIMVAMFTVWLGFVYQSLFVVIVALTVNAAQAALRPVPEKSRSAPRLALQPARPA